ncbi:hypothetical protein BC567DRAFT_206068 [Phyllosticta citribraziliensis]
MHLTRAFALAAFVTATSASLLDNRAPNSTSTSSATASVPTVTLIETKIRGQLTTIEVPLPTAVASANATGTSAAASPTNSLGLDPSKDFPVCNDRNAKPFCLPANNSDVYYFETYYVTWNSAYFPSTANVTILLNWTNDTRKQAWQSESIDNRIGATSVTMKKEWLQGYTAYNLTFFAQVFDSDTDTTATYYDGPTVQLISKPPHYKSPGKTTKAPNGLGLKLGLPLSLGFFCVMVFGLFFLMRKHRAIGLGNIMGRRRGYGGAKSRGQRMGWRKRDDISLQESELLGVERYTDDPPPAPRSLSDIAWSRLRGTSPAHPSRDEMESERLFAADEAEDVRED